MKKAPSLAHMFSYGYHCNRLITPFVVWFACANIACPACSKMFFIERLTISSAISASLILDSAA